MNIKSFDQKSLGAALKAILKSAIATRNKVQEVAVWACATSIINGDVSVANALYETLGGTKSMRKDSLAAYFEAYGNLAWMKTEKKFAFFLNPKTGCTDGKLTPEGEARITGAMWDEAKREGPTVSKYDMEVQVRVFLARMEKLALDPANTIENREALQAVSNAFNRIVAERTLKSMKVDPAVLEATATQQAVFDARQQDAVKAA